MDGMIKVSPELLISTAGEFSNQGTTINTLTGEMLQLATGLASAWQGDGATAYITKFKGLENSIQLMVRMIQEHATDLEEMAKAMFNAGSSMKGKSAEEICFQDFKVFNVKDIMFGVGQITSMNQDELDEVKGRLIPYLEEARKTQGLHMLYLMMTNILEESTELLCCGENAKEQVLEAFELPGDTEKILLKGVVSRKKQMIPVLVTYLQQK